MASNLIRDDLDLQTSTDTNDSSDREDDSTSSDDGQDFQPVLVAGKVLGYQFEPLRTAPQQADPTEDLLRVRLDNTDWCQCGNCVAMPTATESKCCREIVKVWEVVQECKKETEKDIPCITLHPGFYEVCLGVYALQTAALNYRRQNRDVPINDQRRYTAYRQFVRFCFGKLGRHNREVIPACAVNKIRTTFPSPTGNFVGYKVSDFFD